MSENLELFEKEAVETEVEETSEKPNFMPPGILPGTANPIATEDLMKKAVNNELLKRSHKRKGMKPNMCLSVYITTDPNDVKLEVVDLLSKRFDTTPAKMLAQVFNQYLMDQGLFDAYGNPIEETIDKLRNMVKNKNTRIPKLDIFGA